MLPLKLQGSHVSYVHVCVSTNAWTIDVAM